MGVMASCLLNKIFDPFRKEWVVSTPEEIVRQNFLSYMIKELGYPQHLIALEKSLRELPSLKGQKVPLRRIDILCFERKTLSPLLLVECKAVPINRKSLPQVMGYNAFIKAPFIALVNANSIVFGWKDEEKNRWCYGDALPQFTELECVGSFQKKFRAS